MQHAQHLEILKSATTVWSLQSCGCNDQVSIHFWSCYFILSELVPCFSSLMVTEWHADMFKREIKLCSCNVPVCLWSWRRSGFYCKGESFSFLCEARQRWRGDGELSEGEAANFYKKSESKKKDTNVVQNFVYASVESLQTSKAVMLVKKWTSILWKE